MRCNSILLATLLMAAATGTEAAVILVLGSRLATIG
jgi:hypothetical protein